MQAHIVQLNIVWENKAANYGRVVDLLDSAPVESGDLIVLPELFDVGFTLNTKIAIDHNESTLKFLKDLADTSGCTIHGSRALPSSTEAKAWNCATITSPNYDIPLCEYHKIHPFSFGRESESYIGDTELLQYEWDSGHNKIRVCPAICYDLRFPELFRKGLLKGAEAFVIGANWPSPRIHHWRTLCIARAIENQAFVIAANRSGDDPHLPYPGNSLIVDPKGEVIAELGDQEAVLSAEIDPEIVQNWRSDFPVINDIKLIDK
ncbi:MAG: hypothetical protein P1U42_09845 [Phycisphaerales bacterium]|nr:hypothetical protein [Phycisphaerales bacterium]